MGCAPLVNPRDHAYGVRVGQRARAHGTTQAQGRCRHDADPAARRGTANRARAEAAVRAILERGAVPIVLGGDDSVPIPFFRAFEGRGPLTVVQVDAHLDWRDELHGERNGYSSPMRRASELPWITGMIQVGLRGTGSARQAEVDDARAWGSRLVTAREVHDHGIGRALDLVPDGGAFLVTIDCDGIHPADFHSLSAPAPGGITFYDVVDLIRGVAAKGRIAGLDIVEFGSAYDLPNGIGATTCARLVLTAIGAMIQSGQLARR
ncbi:MAG: agmatinase [Alphaproteobacteria bacterium]|nr:agmatinase [Alphaproteobacteria bacterium]